MRWNSQYGDYLRYQNLDGAQLPTVISHFQQNTSVTVQNTVTETSIFTTGLGSRTFGAGWFNVGSIIRINILGTVKTLNGSQTQRIRAYLDAVNILDTGAVTLPSIASATAYRTQMDFSFSAIGASGSCGGGWTRLIYAASTTALAATVPTVATINTTASHVLDITTTWGAANSANVDITYGVIVECLG